jgi:hypothetical protein
MAEDIEILHLTVKDVKELLEGFSVLKMSKETGVSVNVMVVIPENALQRIDKMTKEAQE